MSVFQFSTQQVIPASIEEVWDFISSPKNLKHITPAYMNFEITSEQLPKKMYAGMIIRYKVSPLPLMRVSWVTEITHTQHGQYFVDEQRSGPFRLWHHQHKIEWVNNKVLMSDIVTYQPHFGVLGNVANILFIKKQLRLIFDYRKKAIEKKFGFSS